MSPRRRGATLAPSRAQLENHAGQRGVERALITPSAMHASVPAEVKGVMR
jgi:hypothetical protein